MLNSSTGFISALLGPASFEAIFNGGAIDIFTGDQPASADEAAGASPIARITAGGGAWSPGSSTNGLQYQRGGRAAYKLSTQPWVLRGVGSGEAAWFRVRGINPDAGLASLVAPRIDGAIGLIDAPGDVQLYLPTLTITPDTSISIPSFFYMIPPI